MPRKKKSEIQESLLLTVIEALQDKKAESLVSLELAKIPASICEHFVICTGKRTSLSLGPRHAVLII